jgi:hypothetical protein
MTLANLLKQSVILPALVVVTIAMGGCGAFEDRETLADLPSLAQIDSRIPRNWGGPTPGGSPPQAKLYVRQLALPIDYSLDEAWSVTNRGFLPRATRGAWEENGFRIGLLPKSQVAKFKERLPSPLDSRLTTMYAAGHAAPMMDTPQLNQPYQARVPLEGDRQGGVTRLRGGRIQLLAKAQTDTTGQVYVHFTPHHYKPEISIKPRGPMAKELDGRVFEELSIRLPRPRNQYLVIGLHRPQLRPDSGTFKPPQPDTDQSKASEGSDSSGEQDGSGGDAETPPWAQANGESGAGDGGAGGGSKQAEEDGPEKVENPLQVPPVMGRALFTGSKLGRPRQLLLVIDIRPLN